MWEKTFDESNTSGSMYGYSVKDLSDFKDYLDGEFIPCLKKQLGTVPEDIISDIGKTDFDAQKIREIFETTYIVTESKWGEAFSACQLERFHSIDTPFPVLLSDRNPRASSAGVDIVGFVKENGRNMFLLGEVKTSSETNSPPSVAYKLRLEIDTL